MAQLEIARKRKDSVVDLAFSARYCRFSHVHSERVLGWEPYAGREVMPEQGVSWLGACREIDMRRLAIAVAAAAASVASVTPAYADDFFLGTIEPGTADTAQFKHQSTNGKKVNFTDNVFFEFLSGTKSGTGVYTLQYFPGLKNIMNATISLVNVDTGVQYLDKFGLTSGDVFSLGSLTGGRYTATINGTTTGKSGGDYQISFAAPVPEPAVVGSMGLGLGLAGFAAARRRRRKTVAA